ncbi:MAG: FkbM family methyltransferase, partial [Bacteroidia bacterium]
MLRSLPSFRGKYRIGTIIQKTLMGQSEYQQPEVMVKMKKDFELLVDIRSQSHLGAFWCGEYDSSLIQKFCDLFQEDWVVLDIGANVGYYTIPMAQRLKELNGELYAFEPLTENYNALVRSAKQNSLSNATIEKIGLGEKHEKLGITLTEAGETGNAVITNDALMAERGWEAQEYIQIERLDDFAETHQVDRCDFIKVDIEGAEVLFLRGAKEIITKHRP